MSFSADIIFGLVYEAKPYGLFLIENYYCLFKQLDPDAQHKYACTLCNYTVQLIYFMCTLTGCYYSEAGGFLVTNNELTMFNWLRSIEKERNLLVVGYSCSTGAGHVYCYIMDQGKYFKIESSLDEFSAQQTELTSSDVLKELLDIFGLPGFSTIELKEVKIPSDEELVNNALKLLKIPIPPGMKNLYNLLTDPDYPTYEYSKT